MFTLEQQIFIQCFFSNGERLGPIRHRVFEEFPDLQGT
jgi:hypothetical protein